MSTTTGLAGRDKRALWIVALVGLVLVGLVVALRVQPVRERLTANVENVALLRAVMQPAADVPFRPGEPARALAGATPATGFQARALARLAAEDGDAARAEALLLDGIVDDASAYLTQFELCRLYWAEDERERALESCKYSRDSVEYWLAQGYRADQGGDPAEALAYYRMAAYVDPDSVRAWQHFGRSLFADRRYADAVLAYERVLALDSTPTADVFSSLSTAYLALGNTTMARDVLSRGLLVHADQRDYFLGMAEAFQAEGDLEAADSWYVRLLQRWPQDAQVWAARGRIAAEQGRLEDALSYYEEATAYQPDGFGYWMNLAATAADAGRVEAATEAYDRALALRPSDVSAWMQAGRFLTRTGQTERAHAAFEQVLTLEPGNSEAVEALAALPSE